MFLKFDLSVRAIAAATLTVAVAATCVPSAAEAQMVPPSAARQATKTEFASRMYVSAMGRIARGEPAAAVRLLDVLVEIAPDLPELQYSRAVALTLADFERRAESIPALDRALAADPANPLYKVLRVLADPRHSVLRNGDLYFSAALPGDIAQRLKDDRNAPNAKFLARVFSGIEGTGDQSWPYRLSGFASMLADGGAVTVAPGAQPIALGQLLAVAIPSERFAPYEAQLVARVEARGQGASPRAIQLAQRGR